jgi:DNA-binding NarL/FixJ family response regulator
MIRTLIAADQPLLRTGVRTILATQPDLVVVGEAQNRREAVEQSQNLRPDVVLVDVRPPMLEGMATIRQLVGAGRDADRPGVLMLTAIDTEDHVHAALHAGVSGILVEDCDAEELIRAVHAVARRQVVLSSGITERLITNFLATHPRLPHTGLGVLDVLTSREQEVLRLLSTGRSNAEIASHLFISDQTAKTHVRRVLNKLKLRDRVHAVVFGYENGVVVPGQRRP